MSTLQSTPINTYSWEYFRNTEYRIFVGLRICVLVVFQKGV